MPDTTATTEVTDNSSTEQTFFLFRWGAGIAGWMYRGVASVITGIWMLSEMIRNFFGGSRRRRDSNNSGTTHSFLNNEADAVVNDTTEELSVTRENCGSIQDFLVAQHNQRHPDVSSTSPYASILLDQNTLNFLLANDNQAASFILHLALFPRVHYIDFTEVDFSAFENEEYNRLQQFLIDILESNPFITRIKFPESINYDKFTRFDLIAQKMSQHRAFYVTNYRRNESGPEQEGIKNFYLTIAPEIIATRDAKISELYTRLDSSASASSVSHLFPAQQIIDIFNRFKENIISFLRRNQEEVSIDKTNESFKLCASVEELKIKTVEISDSIQQNLVNATREPRVAHVVSSSESAASDDSSSSALIVVPTTESTENKKAARTSIFSLSHFFGSSIQKMASSVTSLSNDNDERPCVFIIKKIDLTEGLEQAVEKFKQMTAEVNDISRLWEKYQKIKKIGNYTEINNIFYNILYRGLLDVTEDGDYDSVEGFKNSFYKQKKFICFADKFDQFQRLTGHYSESEAGELKKLYQQVYAILDSEIIKKWIVKADEFIRWKLEEFASTTDWIDNRQIALGNAIISKQQDGIKATVDSINTTIDAVNIKQAETHAILDAVNIKQDELMMSALEQAAVIDKIKADRASKKSKTRVSTSSESSLLSGLSNGSSHSSKESLESLCSGNSEETIIVGVIVPDENQKMSDATSAINTTKIPRGKCSPCFHTEVADALIKKPKELIVDAEAVHVVDGCFNN